MPEKPKEPPMTPENIKSVCMTCKLIYKGLPDAYWVSHGYCPKCGKEAMENFKKSNPESIEEVMTGFGFERHSSKPGYWVEPYSGLMVRHRNVIRWAKESPDLKQRIHNEIGKLLPGVKYTAPASPCPCDWCQAASYERTRDDSEITDEDIGGLGLWFMDD